jgi:HlyD family secretion protein
MKEGVGAELATQASARPSDLRPRRWFHWVVGAVALLAAAGGGFEAWRSLGGSQSVRYVTASATRGTIARTVAATGTVNPVLTIIVGSYVSGVIQRLSCDFNTLVKVGQVCAKIDPRPYQTVVDEATANLGVAKAQLAKDKANLAYAELNNQRNQLLLKQDSVSKDVADQAKNIFDQATAQVGLDEASIQQYQAALQAAQVNLGYTDIISPVDGIVVSRNVTQGQTVASSLQTPTLFLIATDLKTMQIDTNVSESDVGGVKQGNKATFTVDAYPKRSFAGTVNLVRVNPQTVQNVVTYDAVVNVNNDDLALFPGMTASTSIVIDQRADVLRVPSQALRYVPGGLPSAGTSETTGASQGARVWALRGGAPVAVDVTTGLDDDSFVEIVKGDLQPGDAIILSEDRSASSAQRGTPGPRF